MFCICRLFANYPDYQDMFTYLQDLSAEQLRKTPKMRAHASVIMNNLNAIITSLDDMACVTEMLRKIIVTHTSRGVTPLHYKVLIYKCSTCLCVLV